jgi:hypothetical protein
MAAFEVIALDTATPQLRAPGASDTYTFPRAVEMPLGTANGVLYLNGSKVVTSGSALTFDGTDLAVGNAGGLALFKRASDGLSVGQIGSRSGTDISVYNAGGVTAEFVAGANELRFNVAASEKMRLDASGNLGLGVTNPAAKLEVYGGASGTVTNIQVGNASTAFQVGVDSSNNCQIRTAQNVSILFYTNATERARIKSTGQLRFVPLAADPAGAEAGDVYYNSGTNKLRVYNGTAWVDLH